MSGVLIIKPLPIAAVTTLSGAAVTNILTADPNEAWIAGGLWAVAFEVDMGAIVTVDSFYLGYTNADAAATWSIQRGTGLGTGLTTIKPSGPMRPADSAGPRHHAFVRLAAPVESRYFRITIPQAGDAPLFIGALVIGHAFEKHREFGAGRTVVDTGARQDLPGGGFGIGEGVTKAQFNFSFVDLTDAETATLWALKKDRGLTRPVLVVEDADAAADLNEAIHYGVFERFQPYERVDPANTRWAGVVTDWA
ncbi:MAG: hypothetical protein AB7E60_01870 [Sphingobium sp.]